MSCHHRVYVLHLDPASHKAPKMRRQNPSALPDARCLYVGCTGLTPTERIQNHMKGYKGCSLVRKWFTGEIFTDYVEYGKVFPYREAARLEEEVARHLRTRGFCVYQK